MFTALLAVLPALQGLLRTGPDAAASCQEALSSAAAIARRVTVQRNAALLAIPVALVTGYLVGRRSA